MGVQSPYKPLGVVKSTRAVSNPTVLRTGVLTALIIEISRKYAIVGVAVYHE